MEKPRTRSSRDHCPVAFGAYPNTATVHVQGVDMQGLEDIQNDIQQAQQKMAEQKAKMIKFGRLNEHLTKKVMELTQKLGEMASVGSRGLQRMWQFWD